MSPYRKVTLSLPVKVLRQLKRIAARRQTSVAKLVTQTLEELAAREDGYARARDRHLAWLDVAEQPTWARRAIARGHARHCMSADGRREFVDTLHTLSHTNSPERRRLPNCSAGTRRVRRWPANSKWRTWVLPTHWGSRLPCTRWSTVPAPASTV